MTADTVLVMVNFSPEVDAAIASSLRPTAGDIAQARSVTLELLSAQVSVHESDLVATLRSRCGVTDKAPIVDVPRPGGEFAVPDPEQNAFRLLRMDSAARTALAQLWSQGVIMPAVGDQYGVPKAHVDVSWEGNKDVLHFENDSPVLHLGNTRWRLVDADAAHPQELLTRDDFTEGLENVLGPRGLRCLGEAHSCWRRGLYLAAGNLIAAASEAAWFTIASKLAEDDASVMAAMADADRGNMSKAIKASCDRLSVSLRRSPLRGRIIEVQAMANQLRDVRNYGLHPRTEHDRDREAYFSDAGAAMLVLASRRYFAHLAGFLSAIDQSQPSIQG